MIALVEMEWSQLNEHGRIVRGRDQFAVTGRTPAAIIERVQKWMRGDKPRGWEVSYRIGVAAHISVPLFIGTTLLKKTRRGQWVPR